MPLEAIATNWQGTLVVEASADYRDLTTASQHPVVLGPGVGPWYITSGHEIAWERPPGTIRQWRWIPADPDAPKPGEGSWELTETGSHVAHADALAVLGLAGPLPDKMRVRWFDEGRNNGDCRDEFRLESAGRVTIELGSGPRTETIVWGGPADFNVDGEVDTFDFLAFQNAFHAGEMSADFDHDGVLGFFDFLAFMGEF